MKFSIKDFFSECGQIRRKLRVWSHLLKKSFIEYSESLSRFMVLQKLMKLILCEKHFEDEDWSHCLIMQS